MVVNVLYEENKDIYRLLQTKGFSLPQIKVSSSIIDEENNFEEFKDSITICENCPNCTDKVLGNGPITSPLMIIGDAPSSLDITRKQLNTDAAGFFLTMALEVLEVDRRCIYITNAIKCGINNSKVSPNIIASCYPYLKEEINRVNPNVIITLGNTALKAVTQHFELSVSTFRGRVLSKNNVRIYPTWNPKHVLLQQGIEYVKTRDEFITDLKCAITDIKKSYPNYKWKMNRK